MTDVSMALCGGFSSLVTSAVDLGGDKNFQLKLHDPECSKECYYVVKALDANDNVLPFDEDGMVGTVRILKDMEGNSQKVQQGSTTEYIPNYRFAFDKRALIVQVTDAAFGDEKMMPLTIRPMAGDVKVSVSLFTDVADLSLEGRVTVPDQHGLTVELARSYEVAQDAVIASAKQQEKNQINRWAPSRDSNAIIMGNSNTIQVPTNIVETADLSCCIVHQRSEAKESTIRYANVKLQDAAGATVVDVIGMLATGVTGAQAAAISNLDEAANFTNANDATQRYNVLIGIGEFTVGGPMDLPRMESSKHALGQIYDQSPVNTYYTFTCDVSNGAAVFTPDNAPELRALFEAGGYEQVGAVFKYIAAGDVNFSLAKSNAIRVADGDNFQFTIPDVSGILADGTSTKYVVLNVEGFDVTGSADFQMTAGTASTNQAIEDLADDTHEPKYTSLPSDALATLQGSLSQDSAEADADLAAFTSYLAVLAALSKTGNVVSKLADLDDTYFDSTTSGSIVDRFATTTETPGVNVAVFLRDASGVIMSDKIDVREHIEFRCYDQNLLLGDGTTNMVQRENVFSATDGSERLLTAVPNTGSESQAFTTGYYPENVDDVYYDGITGQFVFTPTEKVTTRDHIGLNDNHYEQTGVIVFSNANVAYEKHNGFTVVAKSSLSRAAQAAGYDAAGDVTLHVVVTAKDNNDIVSKIGVDMADAGMAALVAGSANLDATLNQYVVSRQEVDAVAGFDVSYNGASIRRSVFMNLICDLYRSENTTLVAPLVLLNKIKAVEEVKEALKNADPSIFPLDDSTLDQAKHFMTVARITYKADSNLLFNNFRATADASATDATATSHYTITNLAPSRRLKFGELNGADTYYHDNDGTTGVPDVKEVQSTLCGHSGVYVETLFYFTSMLSRTMLDGESSLTNTYWLVNDPSFADIDMIPPSVYDPAAQPDTEMKPYRKGIASTLVSTTPTDEALFLNSMRDASVPAKWETNDETYDGFYALELMRIFGMDLAGKYPLLYRETGDDNAPLSRQYYEFVDVGYDGVAESTQFVKVSKSFVNDYFGEARAKQLISNIGTTQKSDFIARLKAFVAGRTFVNEYLLTLKAEVEAESFDETTTEPLNKYTTLVLASLYRHINADITGTALESPFDFQASMVMGSHVDVFKSAAETIPFTIELSVQRVPRNLLMETTSLQMKDVTFVNNTLLRLAILDAVGNPIELVLPILLELRTTPVSVAQRREIELKTDYLLEVLNAIEVSEFRNYMWYTKEIEADGSVVRKIAHVGALDASNYYDGEGTYGLENYGVGDNTEKAGALLDTEYGYMYETGKNKSEGLDSLMYKRLMGESADYTGLINEDGNGRLKLGGVRDDPTARGELKDYRYHGTLSGIFAEDVPATRGGFAMQVLRMIKSGLINKPEDNSIISNEQEIIDSIRQNEYSNYDASTDLTTVEDASGVAARLTEKLARKEDGDEFTVQILLDHIFANDNQRFILNEKAREKAGLAGPFVDGMTSEEMGQQKDDVEKYLYMLPLIPEDTISIITTVNGKLADPVNDANSSTLSAAMDRINERLANPALQNEGSGANGDDITSSTVAITGHAIASDGTSQGSQGLYYTAENLMLDPTLGPFEMKDVDADSIEAKKYLKFRERSFTVQYSMKDTYTQDSYQELRVKYASDY